MKIIELHRTSTYASGASSSKPVIADRSTRIGFFLLLGLVAATSTFFATSSTATLLFSFFIYFVGVLTSWCAGRRSGRHEVISLFCLVFTAYVFLAINHYLGYSSDWGGFAQDWRDEYKFYQMAVQNEHLSVPEIFKKSFVDRAYLEYGGYVFYISALSSLAFQWFDGNHLLLQFLGTVAFGALTTIFVFKSIELYVDRRRAFWFTLMFMLCSVFVLYSYTLLRDVLIAFFYSVGFYLALVSRFRRSYFVVLVMVVVNAVLWELRFESGLFFSLITLYASYQVFKGNALALGVLGVLALFLFLAVLYSNVLDAVSALDNYSQFTLDKTGEKEDSFAKYLYQLPSGIKHAAILLNSQIQPFPSWGAAQAANNVYQFAGGVVQVIASYFWFVVFVSLVFWLADGRYYRIIPPELKFLGLVCVVFILLNTANMTSRRIMCVYPVLYLIYVYFLTNVVSKRSAYRALGLAAMIYMFMVVVYLLAKNI